MSKSSTQGRSPIPSHWLRGRRRAALVALALALLVTAGVTFRGGETSGAYGLDLPWLETRFAARERLQPAAPDPDIVLVEIDDRSLEAFPEPLIGWGLHLADAVRRLGASGARVIALDWTQPNTTEEWFPGNDQALAESFLSARNLVLVKMARYDSRTGEKEWIRPWNGLLFALPEAYRDPEAYLGYAELKRDDNDPVVAAFKPVLPEAPDTVSFAARIVERYHGKAGKLEGRTWTIPGHVRVPLQPDGSVLINYARGTGPGGPAFSRYSLADVARLPEAGDPRFRDKVVILGAAWRGSNDDHFVPVLERWPVLEGWGVRKIYGMEIQANMVRTLLSGRPVREGSPGERWGFAALMSLVGTALFFTVAWGRALLLLLAAGAAWALLSLGLFLTADYALPVSVPLLGLILAGGGLGAYRAVREEGERRKVVGVWGRYQDPRLVEYLIDHPDARGGEGTPREATILFADLVNFTRTVESLSPPEALRMLNRYLDVMGTVVREYGGWLDKYLGDGLLAQWNALEPLPDHAEVAVRACLEMQRRALELNQNLGGETAVAFGLRLTLHTGPVVVGSVGSTEHRLEFTSIGDTLNVTSRLQETAKQLGCELLISESTYAPLRDLLVTGKEAEVEIRGRARPLRVYEVLGLREEDAGERNGSSGQQPDWEDSQRDPVTPAGGEATRAGRGLAP